MHNYCTPHIIKGSFENFLIHRCNYVLLSQMYCVWQVVKTPTIISNNPVFIFFTSLSRHMLKCLQLFILHRVMKSGNWDLPMCMADWMVRMHDTEGGVMTVCVRICYWWCQYTVCCWCIYMGYWSNKGEMNCYQNHWSIISVESVITEFSAVCQHSVGVVNVNLGVDWWGQTLDFV
jgi:hypothetical protein